MKTYENFICEKLFFEYKGTTRINENDAFGIIKGLKDFDISDKPLFRGINLSGDYYIVDPKLDARERTIGILPTLIMEFNEKWKDFPSRQNAIFCSNSKSVGIYGKIFRVIPFDDSEWGVSTTSNYKSSFEKILNELKMDVIGLFSRTFKNLYKQIVGGDDLLLFNKNQITKDNYEIMLQQIDEILLMYKQNPIKVPERWQKILESKSAKEFIDYYFEPYSNGFKCLSYTELQKELGKDERELWTNSKCLLINHTMI